MVVVVVGGGVWWWWWLVMVGEVVGVVGVGDVYCVMNEMWSCKVERQFIFILNKSNGGGGRGWEQNLR